MNKNDIKTIIRDYIVQQFLPGENPENITDQTRFFTGGILDSLASLKLVSFLEEKFGVKIEAHEVDVDHLDTLDTIADMVNAKQA